MVKKCLIFFISIVSLQNLQASSSSKYSSASPDLEILAFHGNEQIEQYEAFRNSTPSKVVFFGIKNGYDTRLLTPLVGNALKSCPSPELFVDDINNAVRTDSPGVIALKAKINNSLYDGRQRAEFALQLQEVLAREFIKLSR